MRPTFKRHWRDLNPDQKRDLCVQLHTSRAYLSQLAHRHRSPSTRFAILVRLYTGRDFTF